MDPLCLPQTLQMPWIPTRARGIAVVSVCNTELARGRKIPPTFAEYY